MSPTLILVTVIIAVALFFDFVNGFHDAANSVATVVATRVLHASPGGDVGCDVQFVSASAMAREWRRPSARAWSV